MRRYVLRRLLQGVFVLWAAFTLSFVVLYTLPGNPVLLMLGGGSGAEITVASKAQVAQVSAEYGFDKPVVVQYLLSLSHAVRGGFGRSIQTGETVTSMISGALGQTLELSAAALLLSLVVGVGIALASVYTRSRVVRQLLLSLPSLGVSMPSFWTGLILIELFSFRWAIFPAVGNRGLQSLVLPAITLALPTSAVLAQLLSRSLRSTLAEPFVEAVRARGAGRLRVLLRHVLRTASIPTLTMVGVIVGNMVAGSVVVETVFSRVGIGRLAYQAVTSEDIPVIQGLVVLSALIFVVVTLGVDLIYQWVDPRTSVLRRRLR